MPTKTIILPPGTEVTRNITVPICGDWHKLVRTRVTTSGADATIHQWVHIALTNSLGNADGKIRYRRVGIKGANNWYNLTLFSDEERGWWLSRRERIVKLTYTSTNPLTFIYETVNAVSSDVVPALPAAEWNKKADAKPWETNLASNNSTERLVPDGTRNVLGVYYWTTLPPQ
jgi:hypothetical protein